MLLVEIHVLKIYLFDNMNLIVVRGCLLLKEGSCNTGILGLILLTKFKSYVWTEKLQSKIQEIRSDWVELNGKVIHLWSQNINLDKIIEAVLEKKMMNKVLVFHLSRTENWVIRRILKNPYSKWNPKTGKRPLLKVLQGTKLGWKFIENS